MLLSPVRHRPTLPLGPLRWRQGMQPGVVPQPRQELHPRLAFLELDQRKDHARKRERAVEDSQVATTKDLGPLPHQFDRQHALGSKVFLRAGGAGTTR
jgi:hypothetical protein